MTRFCNSCKETLPETDFQQRMKRGKLVYRSRCTECTRADGREHWKRVGSLNPPPFWRRHRLTDDQYWALHKAQNGRCANTSCPGVAEVIDHDHGCCPGKRSCGKCVRGLLCGACNTAEGFLGGDPSRAVGLSNYMLKYTAKTS